MKFFLLISLTVLSLTNNLFAQVDNQYAENKRNRIKDLDKWIKLASTQKSCFAAATTNSALIKCDDTQKIESDKLKSENNKQRALDTKVQLQKINENIKKLEELKKEIESRKE